MEVKKRTFCKPTSEVSGKWSASPNMNRAPAIISQPALALEMIIHFGRAGLGCRSACLRHPRQFYEDEVQDEGSLTQTVTLLQPLANSLPMFVFLMATQKTKATKTTIKVYSTKPWPSSSTNKRFKRSINDFTSFRQKTVLCAFGSLRWA